MGDDGFGPAVIKRLKQKHDLPDHAHAEDVGTSIRDILFNITLLEKHPEHIIVLDTVDKPGRRGGEVFEISVDDIPEQKIVDYSFHQYPTSNMLKEIQEQCGIKITIIVAQIANKLESVNPGLSKPMRAAVREAAEMVVQLVNGS
ncbi:MAG: hydrogenase maturation protease [bacterium]|nr:MAG: hydrogenase maturation protease [bacterium]